MPETPSADPAGEAPLPDHFALTHVGANLVLEFRWFWWLSVVMLPFAILWDGYLVLWYLGMQPPPSGPMLGFPMLYVVMGVGFMYYAIAGLVNRTRVTVGGGAVDVRIGPLPWPGSKRVEVSDIAQVYVEKLVTRLRYSEYYSYQVNALTPQNRKLTLVSGLEDRDVALRLEQEIEKALGIPDEYVPGQVRKRPGG